MSVKIKIDTPECDRLLAVREKSQVIGEFLDWLREKGWVIATGHAHDDTCYIDGKRFCGAVEGDLVRVLFNTEKLLAEFFGIDLEKVERERRALLQGCRSARDIEAELEPRKQKGA
jgi:hypothetical protein